MVGAGESMIDDGDSRNYHTSSNYIFQYYKWSKVSFSCTQTLRSLTVCKDKLGKRTSSRKLMNNFLARPHTLWIIECREESWSETVMFIVCQGTEMHVCRVCAYMRTPTFTQRHSPVMPCLGSLVLFLGLLLILLSLLLSLVRQHVMTQSLTVNILEQMGKGPTSATEMFYHSVQVRLKYSVSWLKCRLTRQLMFQLRLCVPSPFWIPCLSFLDASQQIKMHYLQIFCPCYIK